MMKFGRDSKRWAVCVLFSFMVGCTESSVTDSGRAGQSDFTATVSGAVNGEVSGHGILTYLAPQKTVSGTRPGYYLIGNVIQHAIEVDRQVGGVTTIMDARDLVITLRIPEGAKLGTYQLVSADPRKIGEEFEARLEAVVGGQPVSFRSNTEGTLTLDSFAPEVDRASATTINGEFRFSAENDHGEMVVVTGAFDFQVRGS
jgi:hypothetical protein